MAVKKKAVSTRKKVVKKKVVRKRVKTGGRKAGTPNKNNPKLSLLEYARANGGQSPIEFLIDIQNGRVNINGQPPSDAQRVDAAKAAAPYCHPKLRSTEIKGEIIPATFIIEDA